MMKISVEQFFFLNIFSINKNL